MKATQLDKRLVAETILKRSNLYIRLDPRDEDVKVPSWHKKQADLCLQVGYDMPIPIPDLEIDEKGIGGTLSFSRIGIHCFVPWSSIWVLADNDWKGYVFDDQPLEKEEEPAPFKPTKVPFLQVAKGGKKD